ncbi:MAG: hypothetical protein Fur0014_07920 [Rubrivivax sp.]
MAARRRPALDLAQRGGGDSGNRALWPLACETAAQDLLPVKIDPLARPSTPTTAAEMRAIPCVQRLLAEQRLDPRRRSSVAIAADFLAPRHA